MDFQRTLERVHSDGPTDTERTVRRPGDDIAERLLGLAAAVVKLLPALAETPGAKAIVKQLERCGPAGGVNYEEARGLSSSVKLERSRRELCGLRAQGENRAQGSA